MSEQLRWILIVGSVLFLIVMLICLKRSRLSIELSSVWIIWTIGLVLIGIFPVQFYQFSNFLSIGVPVNTVFLITIFALYCLVFFLYLKVAKLEEKLKDLTHYISLKESKEKKDRE